MVSFSLPRSKEHEELILKVFHEFDCESLLLFDFQQVYTYTRVLRNGESWSSTGNSR